MNIKKSVGFYDTFDRSGSATRDTHYCAGCGHGILHKLICEALVDLGIQDRTVIVNPIGCAVFGYYYWDTGNVGAAHGRAQAVATAMNRTLPGRVVISYQGDGDLGAIGFNSTFQAASRGEHFATFFVNNAIYGMTGGQMAPTTLEGQKSTTSQLGRDRQHHGLPVRMAELLSTLDGMAYAERVCVADMPSLHKAKRAIKKAFTLQMQGIGFTFVEVLSTCPTNWGMTPVAAGQWVKDTMTKYYPLGVIKDVEGTV